jgi:hypothetical protein
MITIQIENMVCETCDINYLMQMFYVIHEKSDLMLDTYATQDMVDDSFN